MSNFKMPGRAVPKGQTKTKLGVYLSSSIFDTIAFTIQLCCSTSARWHSVTCHFSVTLFLNATMVMERVLKKSKENFPNCRNFQRCGQRAKSLRAMLCVSCFKARAARSGAQSGGNVNPKVNKGNKGNTKSTGVPRNKGNTTIHDSIIKKRAGKRSGVKRSSKVALVVKKQWLDKILSGEKDWEIRSSNASRRGWIHFAESRAGGRLLGRAQLVDCFELTKTEFTTQKFHHCASFIRSAVQADVCMAFRERRALAKAVRV